MLLMYKEPCRWPITSSNPQIQHVGEPATYPLGRRCRVNSEQAAGLSTLSNPHSAPNAKVDGKVSQYLTFPG